MEKVEEPWITKTYIQHRYISIAITLILISISPWLNQISLIHEAIIMFCFSALLGVWHGGADIEVIRRILKQNHFSSKPLKYLVFLYSLIALLMLPIWLISPLFALALFTVQTIYHFGQGDAEISLQSAFFYYVDLLVKGLTPLIVSFLAIDPEVLIKILHPLLTDFTEEQILHFYHRCYWLIFYFYFILWLLIQSYYFYKILYQKKLNFLYAVLELTTLTILFLQLSFLLAFTVYFCLWHSTRHIIRLAALFDTNSLSDGFHGFVKSTVFPTLATLLIAVFVGFYLQTFICRYDILIQVSVIGLSMLTLPHFLLTDIAFRHKLFIR